jgi:hypothetical protein
MRKATNVFNNKSLPIFILNWAENYQRVIELYHTADHPALSPKSGGSPWCIYLADSASPRGKSARNTRRLTGGWGRGDAMHVAWLGSFSQRL